MRIIEKGLVQFVIEALIKLKGIMIFMCNEQRALHDQAGILLIIVTRLLRRL